MRRSRFTPLAGIVLLPLLGISLFKAPEPEIVYRGSSEGVEQGVVVIRDSETFEEAVEPLSPDVGRPLPNLRKRTILRVVGQRPASGCSEAALTAVSTKNMSATVELQVRKPVDGCECPPAPSRSTAWLVSVSRAVRHATLVVDEVTLPCSEARGLAGPDGPVLLLEGSWDVEPGVRIASDPSVYAMMLNRLGVGDRGPEVDFDSQRVFAVTGRPRSNGCRRTLAVGNEIDDAGELVVTLEEIYPARGQVCAQMFSLPKVFVYGAPSSVTTARVVTTEKR
ncbi:MAG: hypothetical protein OEQ13_06220 [Acidobacteriota bacterium]|nr:hypothetical protein [Acidobacteriota bacterium]